MVLANRITASTLDFNNTSSTTETTKTMHTQIYLVYISLLLHKKFILVDQIGLNNKGIIDLWCTHNKNTIDILDRCYELYVFERAI